MHVYMHACVRVRACVHHAVRVCGISYADDSWPLQTKHSLTSLDPPLSLALSLSLSLSLSVCASRQKGADGGAAADGEEAQGMVEVESLHSDICENFVNNTMVLNPCLFTLFYLEN